MATSKLSGGGSFIFGSLLFLLLCLQSFGESGLRLNYYAKTCPEAENIVKREASAFFEGKYAIAISWIRTAFHDCAVQSCDGSILLATKHNIVSELSSPRSDGIRYISTINKIKEAVDEQCNSTVSCADVLALAAREAINLLGGPYMQIKTGRRDSLESHVNEVKQYVPDPNDSIDSVLSRFNAMGINAEGATAILGAHSVGRTHCVNIAPRLSPTVDPTLDPTFAEYLKARCSQNKKVLYSKNDLVTPNILDNNYYKNLLKHRGVMKIDQGLASHPATAAFVKKMANDNNYFLGQFAKAFLKMSENNPLTGNRGEIRKDCRYINKD